MLVTVDHADIYVCYYSDFQTLYAVGLTSNDTGNFDDPTPHTPDHAATGRSEEALALLTVVKSQLVSMKGLV